MSETDLAYLAGIVDADGYVTATMSTHKGRLYFGAQVGITGSKRQPHDLAASLFGGKVSIHRPTRNPAHLDQFHWQRTGRGSVEPIESLLPYLRIKKERAYLVLELQARVEEIADARPGGGVPWLPVGYDHTTSLRNMVEEIRSAGRGLVRRTWDEYPGGAS